MALVSQTLCILSLLMCTNKVSMDITSTLKQVNALSTNRNLEVLKKTILTLSEIATGDGFIADLVGFIFDPLLPGNNHDKTMKQLKRLSSKIASIERDIEQLDVDMMWESTKLQAGQPAAVIQHGIKLCKRIADSHQEKDRIKTQDRWVIIPTA